MCGTDPSTSTRALMRARPSSAQPGVGHGARPSSAQPLSAIRLPLMMSSRTACLASTRIFFSSSNCLVKNVIESQSLFCDSSERSRHDHSVSNSDTCTLTLLGLGTGTANCRCETSGGTGALVTTAGESSRTRSRCPDERPAPLSRRGDRDRRRLRSHAGDRDRIDRPGGLGITPSVMAPGGGAEGGLG